MAATVISTRFRLRHDKATNWAAKNPVLFDGEPALETDTGRRKVGDGTTSWNDLLYSAPGMFDITNLGDDMVMRWNAVTQHFEPVPRSSGGGNGSLNRANLLAIFGAASGSGMGIKRIDQTDAALLVTTDLALAAVPVFRAQHGHESTTTVSATGGTVPYTFSALNLPTDATLSAVGQLTVPSTTPLGTATAIITVADSELVEVRAPMVISVQNEAPLDLVNTDDPTDTSGWNSTVGTLRVRNDAFYSTDSETRASQVSTIPSSAQSAVVAGTANLSFSYWSGSYAQSDQGELVAYFYDSSNNLLDTASTGLYAAPPSYPTADQLRSDIVAIPTATETIKIEIHMVRRYGNDNNAYFNMIRASISY